jgi:hypothetical protein
VTSTKTTREFSPKELGIIPLKKIGGLRYLMEIWRNQLKLKVMIKFYAMPLEEIINGDDILLPLNNEDILSLELIDVEATAGFNRIQAFNNSVRLYYQNRDNYINSQVSIISKTEMKVLYEKVSLHTTLSKGCLTALRIYHGCIDLGNGTFKYNPIYQPLFLEQVGYDSNTHNHLYRIAKEKECYSYNGTKFTPMDAIECNNQRGIYKQQVRIKHSVASTTFETFALGKDVEFSIFPFQTIFYLIHDNGDDKIFLDNALENIRFEKDYPNKHSFLLSSLRVSTSGPFAGMYANRSHLCPPCNGVYLGFDLAPLP